jgi:hypothetical protein
MSGYTKLFSSIITSTIWGEDSDTKVVWITLLAMKDRNGEVKSTIPGLARRESVLIRPSLNSLRQTQTLEPKISTAAASKKLTEDGLFIKNIVLKKTKNEQ